ncbi:MAG: phosphate signaling complex protein PhoU [Chloroflexota bacterium]
MPREHFYQDLLAVSGQVSELGNVVVEEFSKAVPVFIAHDTDAAQHLIDSDEDINQRRVNIVVDCLKLLATQQPTASDLRMLASNIEIAGELERIHDYIKGIGRVTIERGDEVIPPEVQDILTEMSDLVQGMLNDALSAFDSVNVEMAQSIPARDEQIDVLYRRGTHRLAISVTDDMSTFQRYRSLQEILNYLERTGDRVKNICEWVIYRGAGHYSEFD